MKQETQLKRTVKKAEEKTMQEEAKKIKGAERFIKKQNFKNDFKEARQFHSEQRKERHEEKDREM